MVSDIHLAFAHPDARAAATATEPRDRISVRDHVVEAEIGAFQAERGVQQRLRFNIVVEVAAIPAPVEDDVDRILSYDKITEAIQAGLEAERLNLLETLAERVADRILLEPQARRAFVRIEKLDRGPGSLGVEIVRSQPPVRALEAQGEARPRVLFLSNAAIASQNLSTWIDQVVDAGQPLVLCVGPSEVPVPRAQHPLAQRRIDLLAIEQNAWILAAHAPHCKVVSSRTELDWATKNHQICIWAPSKIVLDSVDEQPDVCDAPGLAAWFADLCHAQDLVVIDADPPMEGALPKTAVRLDDPHIPGT